MQQKYIQHLIEASGDLVSIRARAFYEWNFSENKCRETFEALFRRDAELNAIYEGVNSLIERARRLENEPTAAAELAPLQDTTDASKGAHTPATAAAEPIAVQAETTQKETPAPAPAPEKEVTPAPAANGEKAEKKAAPKATPPAPKAAEQTAPKPEGWIEKPKTDDKLNSASQENYADKSDADLDQERRLLCRDAVLKGNQPAAVREFTPEKFGVRTVGAISREKHGEWVAEFKKTFGV